jgi:hypothetical protein
MNKQLHYIREKIDAIQFGLIRYHDKEERVTLHVQAKMSDENTLVCVCTGNVNLKKLVNKKVSLIQKSENDYLFMCGEVKQKPGRDKKFFYVSLLKACWFVRKSRGTLTWLQEKHVYDITPQDDVELAS